MGIPGTIHQISRIIASVRSGGDRGAPLIRWHAGGGPGSADLLAPPSRSVGRKIATTLPCKPVPSSGCRKPFFAAYLGFPQNLNQQACSYHLAVVGVGYCNVKMVPYHVSMTGS